MARMGIAELLEVPAEKHDLDWLHNALQWAVDLELATLPTYLSGMWSMKQQSGEVYDLIDSVVREEMLHLGLACNMVVALGCTPEINVPTYPGGLPGGVRPGLTVYLAGLTPETVHMYMQIELPEHPLAAAESFPTIGAFYDQISAAFTALKPSLSTSDQVPASISVPDPDNPGERGKPIQEPLNVLATLDDVQAAIAIIKDQGEGTSLSPDAPQFENGELAHYYRFGEIYHGKKLIQTPDGGWQFAGDDVPFPDCYPVKCIPPGGYPGVPAIEQFDQQYGQLITTLRQAWSGGGSSALGNAIGMMFKLYPLAQNIVNQPLPDGSGNYGPDFLVPPQAQPTPATSTAGISEAAQ